MMNQEVYQSIQAREVIKYISEQYGGELEFLWKQPATGAVCRNLQNQKWYAVFLKISLDKLGVESNEEVEIIDLRFDKGAALELVESNLGIYPGYHMNKQSWITIVLNGSLPIMKIYELVDHSYRLVAEGR